MKIQVCTGKACKENFSEYILTRLERDKEFYKLKNIIVESCPCTGNCKKGPSIVIDGDVQHYMNPAKASKAMMDKKQPKPKKKSKK